MRRTTLAVLSLVLGLIGAGGTPVSAQLMPRAQAANLIATVGNGVDEFKNYLGKRGDDARDNASTAASSGRRPRHGATVNQKAKSQQQKKDFTHCQMVDARWEHSSRLLQLWRSAA